MSFIVHGEIRFRTQVYLIKHPALFKKHQTISLLVKCSLRRTIKNVFTICLHNTTENDKEENSVLECPGSHQDITPEVGLE